MKLRPRLKRLRSLRGGTLALFAALALGALLITLRLIASVHVSVLWFRSVGYEDLLWRRLSWAWGASGVLGIVVGSVLFFNLRRVVSTLGAIQIKRRFGDLEIAEQIPKSYALWAAAGLATLVGLWFGGSVVEGMGMQALLALATPEWGIPDPIFGFDLSFFAFRLPLLRTVVTLAMVVTVLMFTVCAGGYVVTGALRWSGTGLVMMDRARIHLGAIVAAFLALVAARLWIGRYLLLLGGNSGVQGIFGYTDAEARIPALQFMTLVALAAAGTVLWGALRNRVVPVLAGLGVVVAGGLLGLQFYPSLVQRFRVEPNELTREAPYIEMNVRFTRLGFGLDELQRTRYRYAPPEGVDWAAAAAQFSGLPVWSEDPLLQTYRQLEARFRYYDFTEPAIDRYRTDGGDVRVVALAVREVDPTGIEDQNWQNLHLRQQYLAGVGAVASDATDRTPEGQPVTFVSNIPPQFEPGPNRPEGLRLMQSPVYFGLRPQVYAIINPSNTSFLAPDSTAGIAGVHYPEGVVLSSWFRTLSFAWELGEPNLLFASEVGAGSRMVIHRQVSRRAREIFPQLRYPEPAYPVVHEGRIVWLLDGFTTTRNFPLAAAHPLEFNRPLTYVRNSVRVVVDGVTGEVSFYRMPGDDPVLATYDRAFPGLFRPFDELPAGLRGHLRYPRRLLDLQSEVLRQYHQETAQQFHAQQDVWTSPTELGRGESPVAYRPEYGYFTLPGENEPSFVLSTVFVPAARQNLTAILAGRVDVDGRHELFLYQVAVEDQAPGPRQVEALVEQDPAISQQLSLWRTGGSQVWTGHLHVVPVGEHLLYMEALFLASESDAIPELRRFVVSDGVSVVMEPTLEESLAAFAGRRVSARDSDVLSVPITAERWPAEALDLLRYAEGRLREGDWPGFGTALEELEDLLERLSQAQLPSLPGAPGPPADEGMGTGSDGVVPAPAPGQSRP